MKAKQIEEGKQYWCKVSGQVVTVTVTTIYSRWDTLRDQEVTRYRCRNEKTRRVIEIRSAQRFCSEVKPQQKEN